MFNRKRIKKVSKFKNFRWIWLGYNNQYAPSGQTGQRGQLHQAKARQPSQKDCSFISTRSTHTIEKLREDLFEGQSKPSSTFLLQNVEHQLIT